MMILDPYLSWPDFFEFTVISPLRIVTAGADTTSTTDIMSAHHLSIAKASFAAGLLRPDVTKVGREDLTTFHALLEAAITRCTPRNIQKCKEWIVGNITPSAARTAALAKYLSSLSKHMQERRQIDSNKKTISISRKKLHILYIIHDVAHHAKYHTSNLSASSTVSTSLQPVLVELVRSTVAEQRARVLLRLHKLLEVWEGEKIYSRDFVIKLRQAVTGTSTFEQNEEKSDTRTPPIQTQSSESAFIMPATHGDPATPYYDLPAGNLLPFLEPGSSASIRPEQVRPLRFNAVPADRPLVNALKEFLKDVDSMEHKYNLHDKDAEISEIDEMGQITIRDEAGDVSGDTYYGWSRAFCEKMKRRRNGLDSGNKSGRSLSRESSRSLSRSPRKRRRYSDSEESHSASRSRSPPSFRAASPAKMSKEQGRWQPPQIPRSYIPGPEAGSRPMPQSLPSSSILFNAPPFGPNGIPVPPPRPPNWNGPWPPPPPVGVPFPPPNFVRNNNFPPPPRPPGYPGAYDYGGSYR